MLPLEYVKLAYNVEGILIPSDGAKWTIFPAFIYNTLVDEAIEIIILHKDPYKMALVGLELAV